MRPSPYLSLRIRSYVSLSQKYTLVPANAPVQKPIEAAYYRGGESRAVIIQPHSLSKERAKWPSIFRQIMGSGDPYGRQLDGMGAGISSLSNICLVEPYGKRTVKLGRAVRFRAGYGGIDAVKETIQAARAQEEAQKSGDEQELDIDYTFIELGMKNDQVDVAGNYASMSSAIGPYAYNAGLLPPHIYALGDGEITVKIRNTNTGKLIDSTFEVVAGQAIVAGDYAIDGVSGQGSKIKLDFKDPYGSTTGQVLPTGKRVDNIRGYRVSCIDGANPAVFIRADDIRVDGTILPSDFNKLPDKLALLESIRKAAGVAMGIAPTEELVPRTIPKIGLVSQSSSHPVLSGLTLKSSQTDVVIRFLSDTQPHRAIPLTAALTTAVAACIPGTIVEQMLAPELLIEGAITIGHASGRLRVKVTMDEKKKFIPVTATVYTTAKRLFEGDSFWIDKKEEAPEAGTSYCSNGRHSRGLAFVLEHRGESSKHLFADDADEDVQATEQEEEIEHEHEQDTDQEPQPPTHQPSLLSYRPTPPLTAALQSLHTLLADMLAEPTDTYPPEFIQTVQHAQRRIMANAYPRAETELGKEWDVWAKKDMHKRGKRARAEEKKREKEMKRALRGRRNTKKELGLDLGGRLTSRKNGGLGHG